jgi:hypothetical protein
MHATTPAGDPARPAGCRRRCFCVLPRDDREHGRRGQVLFQEGAGVAPGEGRAPKSLPPPLSSMGFFSDPLPGQWSHSVRTRAHVGPPPSKQAPPAHALPDSQPVPRLRSITQGELRTGILLPHLRRRRPSRDRRLRAHHHAPATPLSNLRSAHAGSGPGSRIASGYIRPP